MTPPSKVVHWFHSAWRISFSSSVIPMIVSCPSCTSKLKVPEGMTGRSAKCPKCQTAFTIQAMAETPIATAPAVPPPIAVVPVVPVQRPVARVAAVPTVVPAPQPNTKACPFCGEQILAIAKKCKHCNEILDVTIRAAQEPRRVIERPQEEEGDFDFLDRGSRSGRRGNVGAAAAAHVTQHTTVVVKTHRTFPHVLHLVLTVITCGVWLPVWILHYLFSS